MLRCDGVCRRSVSWARLERSLTNSAPGSTKLTASLQLRLPLSRRQTIDKVGQFRLPIKSANKNMSSVMQKSAEFVCHQNRPILLSKFLFSTRKSPNFLEWRAVIGQQSVYTTNLWYRIHAVDMCSYTPRYDDRLTLKQMHDQQISNQRRTHMVRFYVVSQIRSHNRKQHRSVCVFIVCCHFCRHCRDVRSDVCHSSTISSADYLRKLNHAHKSWPTLSIVWLLL